MANSNVASPKKSSPTPIIMPKLDDDLVLNEVVSRLPLKFAVQCSVLNKTFYRWISETTFARRAAAHSRSMLFYCSANTPKIFTRLCRDMSSIATSLADRNSGKSVDIDKETIVIASCNGLLLVYFGVRYSHYLFNPVTGKVMYVDYPLGRIVGLALDFADDHAHFKLVSVHVGKEPSSGQTLLIFSVVAPRVAVHDGPSMVLKSQVNFVAAAPTNIDENVQPVYANGCLFWLGDGGAATVAFDLEKEKAVAVKGPIFSSADRAGKKRWLGVVDGAVHFAYALPEEIVVCGFDHSKEEWAEKHRIPNVSNPRNNDYGNGEPLFYDGGRLFFLLRKRGEDGHVLVYDVVRDMWERSWNVAGWTDARQLYFSFCPTLAKVLSSDLMGPKNNFVHRGRPFADTFGGLTTLFRSTAN